MHIIIWTSILCLSALLLFIRRHRLLAYSMHSDRSSTAKDERHIPNPNRKSLPTISESSDESESEGTFYDEPLNEAGVNQLAREVILDYFNRTGVHHRFGSRIVRPDVENIVRAKIDSCNMNLPDRIYRKYLTTGLDIAATAYRYIISSEVQAQVALCTFCTALFDDGFMGPEAMSQMVPRYHARQPQLHPVLDLFVETMTVNMREHFSTYSANAMATSWLEFANSEMFLRGAKEMPLTSASSVWIEHIRLKEGFGEAYASFIWPKHMCPETKEYIQAYPDTMNFINLINDLFSYYKEAKAGETGTYLHSYSTVHKQTTPQVMRGIVEQTVAVVKRIRAILGEGRAREAWENFAAGYTQFHLHTDRYKLKDILPEFF